MVKEPTPSHWGIYYFLFVHYLCILLTLKLPSSELRFCLWFFSHKTFFPSSFSPVSVCVHERPHLNNKLWSIALIYCVNHFPVPALKIRRVRYDIIQTEIFIVYSIFLEKLLTKRMLIKQQQNKLSR